MERICATPDIVDEIAIRLADSGVSPDETLIAVIEADGWLVGFSLENHPLDFTANEITRYTSRAYRMTVWQLLSLLEPFFPPETA